MSTLFGIAPDSNGDFPSESTNITYGPPGYITYVAGHPVSSVTPKEASDAGDKLQDDSSTQKEKKEASETLNDFKNQ